MKATFIGTLDTLLDTLNSVSLSTLLEMSGKRGKPRATRQIGQAKTVSVHMHPVFLDFLAAVGSHGPCASPPRRT